MGKVTRLDSLARLKSRLGRFGVPCMVSDRWMRFSERSCWIAAGEVITVDVMSGDPSQKKPRRLARLFVTREDLEKVLARVVDGTN
jgi:hypothetical protein